MEGIAYLVDLTGDEDDPLIIPYSENGVPLFLDVAEPEPEPPKVKKYISKRKIEEDEMTCAICWNIFTDPVMLDCEHTFCNSCLVKMAANGRAMDCPMCRSPMQSGGNFDEDMAIAVRNFKKKKTIEIDLS